MSFAEFVLGRKNPSAAEIHDRLEKTKADIAVAGVRIVDAKTALERIAYMSDAEHAAAEAELPAAERSKLRLEKRLDELTLDLVVAQKAEGDAAFAARRKAVQKRVDAEYPKHLIRLNAKMAEVADIATVIEEIENEARNLNAELQHARKDPSRELPEAVETPHERYFVEADTVIPAKTVAEQRWMSMDGMGRWREENVFGERDGKLVPTTAGAELRTFKRSIPERRMPGRRMSSPLASLNLPATRLDGEHHWPKKKT